MTAPAGFVAAGVCADIKGNGRQQEGRGPARLTGSLHGRGRLHHQSGEGGAGGAHPGADQTGQLQAVVANSGNANACTGEQGLRDAAEMARLAAEALGIRPSWSAWLRRA